MENLMEPFYKMLKESNTSFSTADHLTYVTYPLIKETKLSITIVENLYLSVNKAMDAIIYYDRLYKRINPVAENFSSRFDVFKTKCARRYNIDEKYIKLIKELRNIVVSHKDSPMEFVRRDKFVICSESYTNIKTIDINKLKEYIILTRSFLEKINSIAKSI